MESGGITTVLSAWYVNEGGMSEIKPLWWYSKFSAQVGDIEEYMTLRPTSNTESTFSFGS